ncbi:MULTISPECIES: hypothetical protein [unclassified Bacillus cereus group]|uniref:hypothetical protein n=1 Tax=unclassified Bacillus cereus group TaxID=2750818 RepID=UPI001F59AEE9|nr:hypothetical protein [Bacillus cereus group sp. BfR-BA-02730]MDX5808760.1 hypothetical protein [Bacillus cereus group sp. BfR-BA-02730]
MINIVISKMSFQGKTYIKVFYVMNEHVMHIKVLEKVNETYRAVSVNSLGNATALKILTDAKDDVHVDPIELIDVYEYMDNAFENAKHQMINHVNQIESWELLSFNEIGGQYFALIDDRNTPIHKMFEIGVNDVGQVDRMSPVPYSHIHELTKLLLPEFLRNNKRFLLQTSENQYLGIVKEGKDVVACIFSIKQGVGNGQEGMIYADGAFAFKETSEGYMRYTEFPEKIEKKIEKSSKTLMNFLIELFERK